MKEKVKNFVQFAEEVLNTIVEDFGKKGVVFSNESQFQFRLAWELQELFKTYHTNYRVALAVLSINQKTSKVFLEADSKDRKRMYTDIVVDLGNDAYVAIELKYKTKGSCKETNKTGFFEYRSAIVGPQGAHDLGAYDYLADVERLEQLVRSDRSDRIYFHFTPKARVLAGFAIMISNDSWYWDKNNHRKKNSDCDAFLLTDKRVLKNELAWKKPDTKTTQRQKSIQLFGEYQTNWKNYLTDKTFLNGNPEFRYLLLKISPCS